MMVMGEAWSLIALQRRDELEDRGANKKMRSQPMNQGGIKLEENDFFSGFFFFFLLIFLQISDIEGNKTI